jgi:class 3 adenylate cyclase/tetratricopeptide (TPR) repeat protein
VSTCARCGQENPEGFRFCGACGAPLEVAQPAREVRKVVTVLFADVVGSTPLGERLDPESLRRVMARWFEAARAVLERHGGSVEKFIGDAVMAVFGVPQVHEDDALRAVRAAAELRDSLVALNGELERDYLVRIDIRTGVNTGEVVTGTAERLATGDAVHVAQRLEQEADPGEILMGETTYRLVRDAVETDRIDGLSVKGKAESLTAHRLIRVETAVPGVARRLDSPLVGRERERRLLGGAYERAVEDRACQLFTVLGAAGVGKTRLVEDFVETVGAGADVLRGRCLPYGEGITYWPVVEMARSLPELERVFTVSEEASLVAERLRPALGERTGAGSSEEISWAVRKVFEALAQERPVVAVFDDIHWAEPTLLDLVEHVADWSRDAPILLVCLARPELLESRPGWAGGKLNATSVLLEPLADAEAERLIENLLGASVDASVGARITEAAGGNPLFVEEMVGMLIDDELLERANGSWVPTRDVAAVAVPETIRALLSARIDQLNTGERSVLECASVEGNSFHLGAVTHLAPEHLRDGVGGHLMTLVRKELVRPQSAELAGEEGFRFRHLLIRDAAYEALSKDARAELHRRFAAWLQLRTGTGAHEYEEIVGYHLEQAFRYRRELGALDKEAQQLARDAANRLGAAGRRALARHDLPAAAALLERAVALLPREDASRLALVPDLGIALTQTGGLARAESVLGDALLAAVEIGDRRAEHHLRLQLVQTRVLKTPESMLEQVANDARAAIGAFEELGDEKGLGRAWHLSSLVEMWSGRLAQAEQGFARAVEYARAAGDGWQTTESLPWMTGAAFYGPRPAAEVEVRIKEIRELSGGDAKVSAWSAATLVGVHAMQGRFDDARAERVRANELLEDLGLQLEQTWAAHYFASLARLEGDPEAAEAELLHGIEASKRVGETSFRSSTVGFLADVAADLGRNEEAIRLSEESEALGAEDDVMTQVLWRSARARALARLGRQDEAERLAREALARARRTEDINQTADVLCALAETLRVSGRDDEARAALSEALELYERKGNVVMAARTRELLAGGDGHR